MADVQMYRFNGTGWEELNPVPATHYHDNRYMRLITANGYQGLARLDGNTTDWIRTTSNGIIPYASGGSSALGTSSWQFNSIYGVNIYQNGQKVIAEGDSRLTNARPASDVYAWAKASSKPSYTWSEIGSKPTWIGSSKPVYSFSELSSTDYLTPTTAFELGAAENLDDLKTAGFYYQTANADTTGNNYPANEAGSLLVQKSAGGVTQMYITYNDGDIYTRAYYQSWSAWKHVSANTWRGIHDAPVNGATTTSISSNWAYDHANASNPHGITLAGLGGVATNDPRLSDSRPASDVYSWAKASSKPSYTWSEIGSKPSVIVEGDSRLTNSRPASDVYAWAKASSKPTYTWSEISGKPTTFAPSSHSHSYSQITGRPTFSYSSGVLSITT